MVGGPINGKELNAIVVGGAPDYVDFSANAATSFLESALVVKRQIFAIDEVSGLSRMNAAADTTIRQCAQLTSDTSFVTASTATLRLVATSAISIVVTVGSTAVKRAVPIAASVAKLNAPATMRKRAVFLGSTSIAVPASLDVSLRYIRRSAFNRTFRAAKLSRSFSVKPAVSLTVQKENRMMRVTASRKEFP